MYHYKAICTRVIDGDTIEVDIDLGCGIWLRKESVRLKGIDTPEVRHKDKIHKTAGLCVKEYLKSEIEGKEIFIQTHKDEECKFGRYLVEVYYEKDDVFSLNSMMLHNGIAREYTNNVTTPWTLIQLTSIIDYLQK